jgi:predicted transcriptional regulator of viral defense system
MRHDLKKDVLSKFSTFPYFTIEGFRQAAGMDLEDHQYSRKVLNRWARSGAVIRLKNGIYMSGDFYRDHKQDPRFTACVSSVIKPQSYISLETILQRHGILTEATYPITAVTVKHTRVFENSIGAFSYRTIKPNLFLGFNTFPYYGININEASLAKALFDFLYFRTLSAAVRLNEFDLVEELRLNLNDLAEEDRLTFSDLTQKSGVRKMIKIDEYFRRVKWHF